ncbi:MAG TPA: GGDEF domain-containing protein [Acidisarcina sp.]|nr:GGDEF domain-containing protein [Acidisarcina sp.]
MISLKKYLDQDSDKLIASTVSAYRSALHAMGTWSVASYPSTGEKLQQALLGVESNLGEQQLTPEVVASAERETNHQLEAWGHHTARWMKESAKRVKGLLLELANTAEAVGERDQRCAAKLSEVSHTLEAIAQMDDLTRMQDSILASATQLRGYVREMVEGNARTIERFQSLLSGYQTQLQETEERTLRDSLTDLFNRRGIEKILDRRVTQPTPFSLVVIDLDNFKNVNDMYGHLAGDQMLQQFAEELRNSCRSTDILGRWGGDEFILILDCDLQEARTLLRRMDRWVFGDYQIHIGAKQHTVSVGASFGVAEWKPGEPVHHLLERADAAMYAEKHRDRTDANPVP